MAQTLYPGGFVRIEATLYAFSVPFLSIFLLCKFRPLRLCLCSVRSFGVSVTRFLFSILFRYISNEQVSHITFQLA